MEIKCKECGAELPLRCPSEWTEAEMSEFQDVEVRNYGSRYRATPEAVAHKALEIATREVVDPWEEMDKQMSELWEGAPGKLLDAWQRLKESRE